MGVVYHANYLVWCEMGRTELLRSLGQGYAELERRGIRLAVSEARVRFHAPARYDDRIRVVTRLSRVRSRAVGFAYRLERADDDVLLARAETELICMDGEGTPRRLPEPLRDLLRSAGGPEPEGRRRAEGSAMELQRR